MGRPPRHRDSRSLWFYSEKAFLSKKEADFNICFIIFHFFVIIIYIYIFFVVFLIVFVLFVFLFAPTRIAFSLEDYSGFRAATLLSVA